MIAILEMKTVFYVEENDETGPYEIQLGKAFDEQGDQFTIEFDSQRLDFIRLEKDEQQLTLLIDRSASQGLYSCSIKLIEDQETVSQAGTREYKVNLIIPKKSVAQDSRLIEDQRATKESEQLKNKIYDNE